MKDHKAEIKTSGDFENDPQGALDALEKSGFAIFMISKSWYNDKRAQKEWRFVRDLKKPMVYIMRQNGIADFRKDMFTKSLIGIVIDYDDSKKTATYLHAMMAAYIENSDDTNAHR